MDKRTTKELLNIVHNNYEEISDKFSHTRKYISQPWQELKNITDSIKDGESIMDVGCGNGRLLELVGEKRVSYIGVDSSAKLLEEARNNYLGHRFINGDILELGAISEMDFDYVFAIALLHHLPGEELRLKALKQLKNKINDKGTIIISTWNLWSNVWAKKRYRQRIIKFALLKLIGKNKMDFGDIIFDWKSDQGEVISKRYYHAFTKRGLRKLSKKVGLNAERCYKDRYNYYLIIKKP